jgi:hypothetical protein
MRLAVRPKPYYRDLGAGVSLGYRRNAGQGAWSMRLYEGAGRYRSEGLAPADDVSDADGDRILDFRQAQAKAHERAKVIAEADRIAKLGPPLTVASAVAEYCEMREARNEDQRGQFGPRRDARSKLKHAVQYLSNIQGQTTADKSAQLETRFKQINELGKQLRTTVESFLAFIRREGLQRKSGIG